VRGRISVVVGRAVGEAPGVGAAFCAMWGMPDVGGIYGQIGAGVGMKELLRHCRGLFLAFSLILILVFACIGLLFVAYVILPPGAASRAFETVSPILFWPLFVMAIVWLGSVLFLTNKLAMDYPETYRALGEPGFHSEYTKEQTGALVALIRFILKREHHSLNDMGLSRLCDSMGILFITYMGGFGVLVALGILGSIDG